MATMRLQRKPTSSPDVFIAHYNETERTRLRVDAEQTIFIPKMYFAKVYGVYKWLLFAIQEWVNKITKRWGSQGRKFETFAFTSKLKDFMIYEVGQYSGDAQMLIISL